MPFVAVLTLQYALPAEYSKLRRRRHKDRCNKADCSAATGRAPATPQLPVCCAGYAQCAWQQKNWTGQVSSCIKGTYLTRCQLKGGPGLGGASIDSITSNMMASGISHLYLEVHSSSWQPCSCQAGMHGQSAHMIDSLVGRTCEKVGTCFCFPSHEA